MAQLVGMEVGRPICWPRRVMSLPACCRASRAPVPVISSGPFVRPAAARSTASLTDGLRGTGGRFRSLALALDVQHAVASLLAEVLDVRADGFGDPQPELEQQQHEQSFAGAFGARGGDQPSRALLAQAGRGGLLRHLRPVGELEGLRAMWSS